MTRLIIIAERLGCHSGSDGISDAPRNSRQITFSVKYGISCSLGKADGNKTRKPMRKGTNDPNVPLIVSRIRKISYYVY